MVAQRTIRFGDASLASKARKLKNYFFFLDELRGVAALSVVLLHASQAFGFGLNSHASLAVDFFFCLSGFVLAHRYDQKLKSGVLLSSAFFLKRLLRLYPLIVAGVGLGVVASLFASTPSIPLADVPILALGALLLLPLGLLAGKRRSRSTIHFGRSVLRCSPAGCTDQPLAGEFVSGMRQRRSYYWQQRFSWSSPSKVLLVRSALPAGKRSLKDLSGSAFRSLVVF
jgi:hypothetical protein